MSAKSELKLELRCASLMGGHVSAEMLDALRRDVITPLAPQVICMHTVYFGEDSRIIAALPEYVFSVQQASHGNLLTLVRKDCKIVTTSVKHIDDRVVQHVVVETSAGMSQVFNVAEGTNPSSELTQGLAVLLKANMPTVVCGLVHVPVGNVDSALVQHYVNKIVGGFPHSETLAIAADFIRRVALIASNVHIAETHKFATFTADASPPVRTKTLPVADDESLYSRDGLIVVGVSKSARKKTKVSK